MAHNGMSEELPVLGEVDGRCSSHSFSSSLSRQNSSGGRFPPGTPRTSVAALSNRRTPTPTKQVALQAVKRKEERKEDFDDVDLEELNSSLRLESERSFLERERSQSSLNGVEDEKASHKFRAKLPNGEGARPKDTHYTNHNCTVDDQPSPQKVLPKENKMPVKVEEKEDSSSDDSDDDSEDEQKEKRRAPNQLLMEFLGCLMEGDFPNAAKLCKMILMYEPDHAEALKFQPLIQERMELNEEMDSDDDESGTDDDEDDDDDESGDDSDNSDDSEDDDDNDDEDDIVDKKATDPEQDVNSFSAPKSSYSGWKL